MLFALSTAVLRLVCRHRQLASDPQLANNLLNLTLIGLAGMRPKESEDRVHSAILNSWLEFPARRSTFDISPADLPKDEVTD